MSRRGPLFLASSLLGLLAAACSSEPSGALDSGLGPRDAGSADAVGVLDGGASAPDAGPGPDVGTGPDVGSADLGPGGAALLDRPVDVQVTCAVAAPIANHSPRMWSQGGHTVVTRGAEALVVRTESTPPSPFDVAPTALVFGPLLEDGTLGPVTTVADLPGEKGGVGAAVLGSDLLMATTDGSSVVTYWDGIAGTAGPTPIQGGQTGYVPEVSLTAGHGGAALAWTMLDYASNRWTSSFARVDERGLLQGSVSTTQSESFDPSVSVAATPGGWAVLRRAPSGLVLERRAPTGELVGSQLVAADGEHLVGRSFGFERARTSLLSDGDGFLAAWTEQKEGLDMGAYSGVRLARLDASGALREPPIWVRAPELDVDEVEPQLSWMGARAALTWARGSHIYICGGCVPDHRIDVVVFDPATMTPVSELVSVEPAAGGLLRRKESWAGETLRIAAGITFHVHSEPGTAVVRCR